MSSPVIRSTGELQTVKEGYLTVSSIEEETLSSLQVNCAIHILHPCYSSVPWAEAHTRFVTFLTLGPYALGMKCGISRAILFEHLLKFFRIVSENAQNNS